MSKKLCVNCKHHLKVEGRINCKCPSLTSPNQSRGINTSQLREVYFDGEVALDRNGVPLDKIWCGPKARYYEEA